MFSCLVLSKSTFHQTTNESSRIRGSFRIEQNSEIEIKAQDFSTVSIQHISRIEILRIQAIAF